LLGAGKWYYKNGRYLILKLSLADVADNQAIAQGFAKMLELARVKITIETVPINEIQGAVIKARDYDILLTGLVLSSDPDPYLYWHSSQTGADGLNLADFYNKEIDKLLEEGRMTTDLNRRKVVYERFLSLMAEQCPAVYLYANQYNYTQNRKLKNNEVKMIYVTSDRFSNVKDWYVKIGKRFKW